MAIPPQYFDQVLSAYGLTLQDASKAPPTYCRKVGDQVVWKWRPERTRRPRWTTDPSDPTVRRWPTSRRRRRPTRITLDGKTVFGTAPITWGPQVINSILAATSSLSPIPGDSATEA